MDITKSCETCYFARKVNNDFHDAICECEDSTVYADYVDNDCICEEYMRRLTEDKE